MDAKDFLLWFIRSFILIAFVIFLVYFVGRANNLGTQTGDMEYTLYVQRTMNSLSYEDSASQRLYPGIIDLSTYNHDSLKDEFGEEEKNNFGILIELFDIDNNPLPDSGKNVIFFNKDEYTFIEPFTFSRNFVKLNSTNYVLVRDEQNDLIPGKMNIILVYPAKND